MVVFDNVVFPGCPDVLAFVQKHGQGGEGEKEGVEEPVLFEYQLHHSQLEYSAEREDAVLVVKLLVDPTSTAVPSK